MSCWCHETRFFTRYSCSWDLAAFLSLGCREIATRIEESSTLERCSIRGRRRNNQIQACLGHLLQNSVLNSNSNSNLKQNIHTSVAIMRAKHKTMVRCMIDEPCERCCNYYLLLSGQQPTRQCVNIN